jgi:Putative prokaryotic signal transducing protein
MSSDDDVTEDRWITIRTVATRTEAELVRGLLESVGIPSWVSTDDAGGVYPFQLSDGARVMIRESDHDAAESLLSINDDAP